MALRKQAFASIGNENLGIISNPINAKNNLSNRIKQPLGNINNIIHNQLGRNPVVAGIVSGKEKKLVQTTNVQQSKFSDVYQDEFEDFCSYKNNDKGLEQKWLEEEIANCGIFEKIIEADKPRTKPITKTELDWIEYFEFGEERSDISKDIDFGEDLSLPELEIPMLPRSCFENLRAPSPLSDFEDLNISVMEEITQNDNKIKVPKPVIASSFDDLFNF